MLHPTVFNTAQICYQLGVRHAVMSPGSRNAPLTISFARYNEIKKWIIPDERSAGFVALGIAQKTKTPVVLCCTSGSALLNYAPAVAEAFYRELPLIILSADRPPELIDQRDGQTIRQFEALKNHVKGSYRTPVILSNADIKAYEKNLIEGITQSKRLPKGPVHINIPFKEPFYPTEDQKLEYEPIEIAPEAIPKEVQTQIDASDYEKILILIGQNDEDEELNQLLDPIAKVVPVIKSPLNNLDSGIDHVDGFINDQADLKPDLLITSGLSVLSKRLKYYLRKHKPNRHLHYDPAEVAVDTYESKPELIQSSIKHFLKSATFDAANEAYLSNWKRCEGDANNAINDYMQHADYSESKAVKVIFDSIPNGSKLHLSNSMPVRYADLFGVNNTIECFSNRGTSGIDGCSSTVVGTSLVSEELNVLITGDLAFLYDRNAFFHNYPLPNLRIIVLNNQGGGIFRLIDGPANLSELEEYFETRHNKTAEYICEENGFEYLKVSDDQSLDQHLSSLYSKSKNAKILEVFTDPEINQNVYKELKKRINERTKN